MIWGYNKWLKLGVDFRKVKDKLLVVNKYNNRNSIITKAHIISDKRLEKENMTKEDYQNKLVDIYTDLYDMIKGIIYK